MPSEVIGREDELDAIASFLDRLESGPAGVVVAGEPGIGKTILWKAGIAQAAERSYRVLSCRGVEAEAAFAFAGLSELVTEALEEAGPALASPRRRALEVALLLAELGESAPDAHAIGLAVLDVLRLLAEKGAVVVALDDLQWLDASSAAVLQIALRRLRDEPIGLLATARETPGRRPAELERSLPEDRLTRLSLVPLSLGALHHLLRDQLGVELRRPELARVHETSGGNPFFALELGHELMRRGPGAGQSLHVPKSLQDLLGGRLSRLSPETHDVLLHAAALARPTVELLAAAHGDRGPVLAALEAGVREGVVELDDSRIRFAHPLLASICYEQAPPWKRREIHAQLANAVSDIEERARHLALAAEGPDAGVAAALEAAAEQAAARGATSAAAELSELAAELSPDDPALARQRRFRTAKFHRLAGNAERAAAMLRQILPAMPPGVDRADMLFELALTRSDEIRVMIELCENALTDAAGDDARSARILAYRSWIRLFEPDAGGALADARQALERAEQTGEPALLAVAIAQIGQVESLTGEFDLELLERGADIEERFGLELEFPQSPRLALARALTRMGMSDRARASLEDMEMRAAARGDERTRAHVLWSLCRLEWLAGAWQRALEHADATLELAEQIEDTHTRALAGILKALVEADLGLVEEARTSAAKGLALPEASRGGWFTLAYLAVLGRLELALGELDAAARYLRELPGQRLALGFGDPLEPVWGDAIETLIGLGELEQARTYLERYEVNAVRLGAPWAVAAAARCRGLLAAAEGDLIASFAAFARAVADLQKVAYPLEQARTLLCLGVVRRQAQQKKAAREALEQALAIFEELGAELWAQKARSELRRISGRRPPDDELTETETRVAILASQGRSNKEIAAELFMGLSTVEMHLSRVYRKLGIRSRSGLGPRLAMNRGEAAQP